MSKALSSFRVVTLAQGASVQGGRARLNERAVGVLATAGSQGSSGDECTG